MTRRTRNNPSSTENGNGEKNGENGGAGVRGNVKWIGTGVTENRMIYYGKCECSGNQIGVGSNVEINLGDTTAVAEVQQLYETFGEDPYRAFIRWYYPHKDLPKHCKHLVEHQDDRELFKPQDGLYLGSEEDIDIETIVKNVTVWEVAEGDTPPSNDYYVRYCFPTTKKSEQTMIPIIGTPDLPSNYQFSDHDEEESEEEDVDIQDLEVTGADKKGKEEGDQNQETKKKQYTSIKEKVLAKYKGKQTQLKENDSNLDNKEESPLSGKMRKNAEKWKTYSSDEVLLELWKTEKDPPRGATKQSLKRKLDEQGSTESNDGSSSEIPIENKKDNLMGDDNREDSLISTTPSKTKANRANNGADEPSLTITKSASPFKSIPKKKETTDSSVFDFDDEMGEAFDSPQVNRSKKSVNIVDKSNKKLDKKKSNLKAKTPNSIKMKGKMEATPGLSQRKTPRAVAKNMLELARKRLHVSAVPETLPCRDEQFSQIFSFVQDRLNEGTGGCMYISGVPGTGKTATVREVIRTLKDSVDDGLIPVFKFIEINGMKLTDPNQAYTEIYKALEGKKVTPDHASDLLSEKFRSSGGNKENIVLLVDELDLLCTRKQNVMYNIFDWPTNRNSRLVVLAIANTMDLPERMMMNRVSSRLGLTRMTFQPYTFKELEEIVISRIRGTDAFEDDALQLVARKVAAVSGDARRCLDICRRAVEISESTGTKKQDNDFVGSVGMKHVDLALKEMFSSPKIIALQCLSDMEVMFMKAVISEFRRTGLEEAIFLEIYDQFKSHCALEDGITPPNMSEAFTICNNLGSCRLLLVEAGNKDVHQRVRLNVNVDDVLFAFKSRGS